jgi:hypothetical protein
MVLAISEFNTGTCAFWKPAISQYVMVWKWEVGLLTSRDSQEDLELGVLGVMAPIGQPTDHGVEQNDENRPERGKEEEQLLLLRVSLCKILAERPDCIQQEEGSQAHGRIQLGAGKTLQGVYEDLVSGRSSGKPADSHHSRYLADGNVDG